MPSQSRYTIQAIQKLRAPRTQKRKKQKGRVLKASTFFGDVIFCLASALTLILLLYWLNNGAFRAAAPLCMALGFYLCRISISKYVYIALQWAVFGLETLIYILCLPFKRIFAWMTAICKKEAEKMHVKRLAKQRKNYTTQQLQNIDKAAVRLLPVYSKSRITKGDNHAPKSKKAV